MENNKHGENPSRIIMIVMLAFILAIDPQAPEKVYAATGGGGVFAIEQVPINHAVFLPVVRNGP